MNKLPGGHAVRHIFMGCIFPQSIKKSYWWEVRDFQGSVNTHYSTRGHLCPVIARERVWISCLEDLLYDACLWGAYSLRVTKKVIGGKFEIFGVLRKKRPICVIRRLVARKRVWISGLEDLLYDACLWGAYSFSVTKKVLSWNMANFTFDIETCICLV